MAELLYRKQDGSFASFASEIKTINNISPDPNGNVTISIPQPQDLTPYIKSVNGSTPDQNGAITLTIPSEPDLTPFVKSINNSLPDENGNVTITVEGGGGIQTINTSITPDVNGDVVLGFGSLNDVELVDVYPGATIEYNGTKWVNVNEGVLEYTYAELETLVAQNKLIPNKFYILKDYVTCYMQIGTWRVKRGGVSYTDGDDYSQYTEKILLRAATQSTFELKARSLKFPNDVVYYDFTKSTVATEVNDYNPTVVYHIGSIVRYANEIFMSTAVQKGSDPYFGSPSWSRIVANINNYQELLSFYSWLKRPGLITRRVDEVRNIDVGWDYKAIKVIRYKFSGEGITEFNNVTFNGVRKVSNGQDITIYSAIMPTELIDMEVGQGLTYESLATFSVKMYSTETITQDTERLRGFIVPYSYGGPLQFFADVLFHLDYYNYRESFTFDYYISDNISSDATLRGDYEIRDIRIDYHYGGYLNCCYPDVYFLSVSPMYNIEILSLYASSFGNSIVGLKLNGGGNSLFANVNNSEANFVAGSYLQSFYMSKVDLLSDNFIGICSYVTQNGTFSGNIIHGISATTLSNSSGNRIRNVANCNIDNLFHSNFIYKNMEYNNIGKSFVGNSVKCDFVNNTVGNNFQGNYLNGLNSTVEFNNFKDKFYYNEINGDFKYNSIGIDCNSNQFGNNFSFNNIGDRFGVMQDNTVSGNILGDDCLYNTFCSTVTSKVIADNTSNLDIRKATDNSLWNVSISPTGIISTLAF